MHEVGVVYLARKKDGQQPITNFLSSYARHPAGLDHQFLIVHKGFAPNDRVATQLPHTTLSLSDYGFDIRAYRHAAESLKCEYLFFLNTFSEILAPDWLKKMYEVGRQSSVGVVGATGSWESMYSNALSDLQSAPSLKGRIRVGLCRYFFQPFPNYHLRTTAFLIRRELFLQVWPARVLTKRAAYLLENGKNSFTQRILQRGLNALVVGKDGVGYQKEDWQKSHTFRSGNQENLLVSDNQTRRFQTADAPTKKTLALRAWGAS